MHLDPTAIYDAFDRFVCAETRCAGATACATGYTIDGYRLRRITDADVREWKTYDLGPLRCECGRLTVDKA